MVGLQVEYPEIEEGAQPRHRFMSSFEQRKETTDRKYQYLLFNAAPYEVHTSADLDQTISSRTCSLGLFTPVDNRVQLHWS